jgi:hypothetical protein
MLLNQFRLRRLQLFASPSDFIAGTGQEPPPFDPKAPPKLWRDLLPLEQGDVEASYLVLATTPGTTAPAHHPKTGKPYLRTLVLSAEAAAAVNLPTGVTNAPGETVPAVQVPLEPIQEPYYLDYPGDRDSLAERLAGLVVRDRRAELLAPAVYTVRDQRLLSAIAAKLDVTP